MDIGELLGRYINWADRYVAPRSRRVVTWEGFLRHGSFPSHRDAVHDLIKKIEASENLRPFLSDRIDRFGYVPRKDKDTKPRGVEWRDKDYALNAFGTHHLHLKSKHSRALLYVSFSREDAFFVMVGDHDSFDDGTLAQAVAEYRVGTSHEFKGILGPASARTMREQNRLQRRGFSTAFQVDGHTVMGAMLTGPGTSLLHTRYADRMIDMMKELEPQLDQPSFGREWFEQNGRVYPATPSFEWVMQYCDLCLIETTTRVGFPMAKWGR